ncbi:hypothetical protein [Psychrobacillus sp. FSL K6-1415]|uniref:hypothetical protein n=1 Tax=Psychrobacillus sp. FSL K6-1415 TaxID=2921544 RepID=UPI0030F85554
MVRKITAITQFILELSDLLDKKVKFTVDEVNNHIENKDVIDWLERELPLGSENGLDFSLFKKNHREWIHEELNSYWGGYAGDERRKWGIENNGLCLLISWSTEIVRDLYGRDGESSVNKDEWL